MARLNKFMGIGRLTKDVDFRTSEETNPFALFSIAINGINEDDAVLFLDCVAFGTTAEAVDKYLKKGSLVYVEGRLQTRKYKDKEGNERKSTNVVVYDVQFLDSKAKEEDDDDGIDTSDIAPKKPTSNKKYYRK